MIVIYIKFDMDETNAILEPTSSTSNYYASGHRIKQASSAEVPQFYHTAWSVSATGNSWSRC